MQVLDNFDAGVVILDENYNVCAWNTFMQAYSGISSVQIMGKSLFDIVPDLPKLWLQNKIQSMFKLRMRLFSVWEDRPWVFRFLFEFLSNFWQFRYHVSKHDFNTITLIIR